MRKINFDIYSCDSSGIYYHEGNFDSTWEEIKEYCEYLCYNSKGELYFELYEGCCLYEIFAYNEELDAVETCYDYFA